MDLFDFNGANLDPFTETYGMNFYMMYMTKWPEYFKVSRAPSGEIMGYYIGKAEGEDKKKEWHGHVSALTVAPEYRRLGLATQLMEDLETVTIDKHNAWFIDLFVRSSNSAAIEFYKRKMGYIIFRTIIGYYSDNKEDAYGLFTVIFCEFPQQKTNKKTKNRHAESDGQR